MGAVLRTGTWWQRAPVTALTRLETVDGAAHAMTIVSDAAGVLATLTGGCKTVTMRGPSRTFTEQKKPFTDNFSRTVVDGLGAAPGGGNWTTTGGIASNYSVSSNKGRVLLSSTNVSRIGSILDVVGKVDARIKVTTDVNPTGAACSFSLLLCYADGGTGPDNHYRIRLTFGSTAIVSLAIAKVDSGTPTDIGASVQVGTGYVAGDVWNLRGSYDGTDTFNAWAWKEGTTEPVSPVVSATDTTFTTGRVGFRTINNTGSGVSPEVIMDDLQVTATWPTPPSITHTTWVRLLDEPYTGWHLGIGNQIRDWANDLTPDVLAIGMEYVANAPAADLTSLAKQIKGSAGYGPLDAAGARIEGADFNDYIGMSYVYPAVGGGTTDTAEVAELHCLDCSGLHRMQWGYRAGLPLTLSDSDFFDGLNLPRQSKDMATDGPGIVIASAVGSVPDIADLRIGDALFWDATNGGDEAAGEMDHLGTYMGVDSTGAKRFISSRKSPNGPTIGDLNGASTIDSGANLYSTNLRMIRRY